MQTLELHHSHRMLWKILYSFPIMSLWSLYYPLKLILGDLHDAIKIQILGLKDLGSNLNSATLYLWP